MNILSFLSAAAASLGCLAHLQAEPNINIVRDDGRVTITFTGKLEGADQVTGPWLEVTNAVSPYTQEQASVRRFYRARDTASIFSENSVLFWVLTGPFQTNFNLAYAGTPDGINPPNRQKPYFDAEFKMASLQLPVTMRVRGNSSLQECSFPKLKMKVSKENRAGTPFEDAREIKIGTHCAEGGFGNIGRLRDERAAWREALAYETMTELGFISPRVRRAIIDYHDTTEPEDSGNTGWVVTRMAFIADDIELVASRLGGRALSEEELSEIKVTPFDPQLITDIEFLHALLGNWDFSLDAAGRGIWNTEVIELGDKTLLPVAGDFDLASFVTGRVRTSSTPDDFYPELGDVERQALYTLEGIRAQAGAERFAKAKERFLAHRAALEAHIADAETDEDGRTNALRHVSAFYGALDTLAGGGKR